MQPKRDPDDRRYWPSWRPGATGDGFTRHRDKRASDHYSARRTLQRSMDVTIEGVGKGRTADAVRQRSRDIYERLLDRIEERVDSADVFTLSELSQAANVAGRIGLGGEEMRSGDIRIHIVRDALPMPDHATIAKDMGHNEIAHLASPSAAPHALREANVVNDDAVTGYDDVPRVTGEG